MDPDILEQLDAILKMTVEQLFKNFVWLFAPDSPDRSQTDADLAENH